MTRDTHCLSVLIMRKCRIKRSEFLIIIDMTQFKLNGIMKQILGKECIKSSEKISGPHQLIHTLWKKHCVLNKFQAIIRLCRCWRHCLLYNYGALKSSHNSCPPKGESNWQAFTPTLLAHANLRAILRLFCLSITLFWPATLGNFYITLHFSASHPLNNSIAHFSPPDCI